MVRGVGFWEEGEERGQNRERKSEVTYWEILGNRGRALSQVWGLTR